MEKILKFWLLWLIPLGLQAQFAISSYEEIKNKRVVRQNYEQSCGAASLATLLNLIDKQHFSELDMLAFLNKDFDALNTNMVSLADLKEVLDGLGFVSNAYFLQREVFDKIESIPMLVKIEDDPKYPHFVIVINYNGDYMQIFDPSYGEYMSSKQQFYRIWERRDQANKKGVERDIGGYVLVVEPKKELEKLRPWVIESLFFQKRPFGGF